MPYKNCNEGRAMPFKLQQQGDSKMRFTILLMLLSACSYDLDSLRGNGGDASDDALNIGDGGASIGGSLDAVHDTGPLNLGTGGTVALPGTGGVALPGTGGVPVASGGIGGMSTGGMPGTGGTGGTVVMPPPGRPPGAACEAATQCSSAFCLGAPGRCCETACNEPGDKCPTGYCEAGKRPPIQPVAYNGHKYVFATDPQYWKGWGDAWFWCLDYGYALASVNDAAENAWLTATVPFTASAGADAGRFWIGFYGNSLAEGPWLWLDGSMPLYTNWAPMRPDITKRGAATAVLVRNDPNYPAGTWDNQLNATLFGFVCESR